LNLENVELNIQDDCRYIFYRVTPLELVAVITVVMAAFVDIAGVNKWPSPRGYDLG